jgi:DNA-binding FadR family transcriptional regulator
MRTRARISAHQFAAQEIKRFIAREGLVPGSVLPSEQMLAQRLGVSRPSLREGVKTLEAVGILQSRHGNGLYVRDFSFDTILESLPYSIMSARLHLRQLLEVREALELGMIAQVLDRIPQSDIAELHRLVDRMGDKARLGESCAEEDRQFHRVLFRCVDNPLFERLMDMFWQLFLNLVDTLPANTPDMVQQTLSDHRDIVSHVAARNLAPLVALYQDHFAGVRARVCDGADAPAGTASSTE